MSTVLVAIIILGISFIAISKWKNKKSTTSLDVLPETFVVVDLETTGLKAEIDEIIEIGAIRYRRGSDNHQTFQALVKPQKKIPINITELTGITQAMVDETGDSLKEALTGLIEFAGNDRLVTFNAKFDMAFLRVALKAEGLTQFKNPVSCALEMARRAWPGKKSYKLDVLAPSEKYGINRSHRALNDAKRALIVYGAAVQQLKVFE